MSQQQLATLLGLDQSYVSRLERESRSGRDVELRKSIANILLVSPAAVGLTPDDFVVDGRDLDDTLEMAASAIRMADALRESGQSTLALENLHPFVVRLEALRFSAKADIRGSLLLSRVLLVRGVALGDVLGQGDLSESARCLERALECFPGGDLALELQILRRRGNELRKSKEFASAQVPLRQAVVRAASKTDRLSALVLAARLSAEMGDHNQFKELLVELMAGIEDEATWTKTLSPAVVYEIGLRGFERLGDERQLEAMIGGTSFFDYSNEIAPQWNAILQITRASVLAGFGKYDRAAENLRSGLDLAVRLNLPRQVERGLQIATSPELGPTMGALMLKAFAYLQARSSNGRGVASLLRSPQG